MNRYQFEDLISSYIDNEITLSKRKEFERYMKDNPDAEILVSSIKDNIKKLNQVPRIKVKSSFNETLKGKIDDLNSDPKLGKANELIFGFSPLNASFLSGLCIAFIVITFLLINPNFTYQKTSESKVANNGLKINNNLINDEKKIIYPADFREGVLKISHGKKKHYQVKIF